MSTCIGEPVSWLRLERLALGELPEAERSEVSRHIAACPSCAECFRRIEPIELPELPSPATPRRPRVTAWAGWVGVASAAAAALLLLTRLQPSEAPRSSELRTKGGTYALELVRLDTLGRQQNASRFSAGDRFKVLLTCPPPWRGAAELVVYQAGRAYFPLPAQTIESCGNRRPLSGAFSLDGSSSASVCVALTEGGAHARDDLARGSSRLPETSVCVRIEPDGSDSAPR